MGSKFTKCIPIDHTKIMDTFYENVIQQINIKPIIGSTVYGYIYNNYYDSATEDMKLFFESAKTNNYIFDCHCRERTNGTNIIEFNIYENEEIKNDISKANKIMKGSAIQMVAIIDSFSNEIFEIPEKWTLLWYKDKLVGSSIY